MRVARDIAVTKSLFILVSEHCQYFDSLKTVCRRSRLLKTEVEGMLLCNVLLAFCALTFCHCLWTYFSLVVCLSTVWVTQWLHLSTLFLSTFEVHIPYVIFLEQLIFFFNIPGQICSANLSWVSPAWSQLSVHTVLSFSLTLPRMASQSPLHLPLSFEYRSEMDFQKSKSLLEERSVLSLWWDLRNPTSFIFQLMEVSLKFAQLRRGGRFSLVNFLLHLICFPPAYHKGNSSLSLKFVSLPHWGTSTWVFLSYLSPLWFSLAWGCLIPNMRTLVIFPLSYQSLPPR